jgi:hypothetical protein
MPGNDALIAKPGQLDPDDAAYYAQLAAATGYSRSTVQKAIRVLEARGWLVRVRLGKNWLTKDERLEVHQSGSAARRRRNVWACTIPPHLRTQAVRRRAPSHKRTKTVAATEECASSVDNCPTEAPGDTQTCTLPATLRVSGFAHQPATKIFKPEQASTNAPPGRPSTKQAPMTRTYRADWQTVRLAKDLRASIYWLRDVPHQRIMPALNRFAKGGWTAADVQNALDNVLAARGWTVPSDHTPVSKAGHEQHYPLRCPWGYLAMLLRGIDHADLTYDRAHKQDLRRNQSDYELLLIDGPPCPHGHPGGHIPSPIKGIRACPLCRRHGCEQ